MTPIAVDPAEEIAAPDRINPGVQDVIEDAARHNGADPSKDHTMVINMGPQHPSTHGVLRLVLEIDGESVVALAPDIGYLHTGIEKTCEAKFYQQVVPLTDRIDYLCPLTNNLAYCLAVEKLLGLEIPERAQYLRVLLNELTRIQSHLVWLGTHAMDIGALTVFLYCFREREDILRIFEALSGQRMMTSYFRIGGVSLEPPLDFYKMVQDLLDLMPGRIDQYENLLTGNPIWIGRLKGIGHLSAADAIALGVTGPPLRASGVDWDLRRDLACPTAAMREVPVQRAPGLQRRRLMSGPATSSASKRCASPSRSAGRPSTCWPGLTEGRIVADAPKIIILPDREQMKTQMESLIHHFKIVTEGFAVPAGEVYLAVESPRGEMGYYVVSDGTAKPYRVHMRNPSFATLQALETMCRGRLLADVVAVIGSIDIVLGEIDR